MLKKRLTEGSFQVSDYASKAEKGNREKEAGGTRLFPGLWGGLFVARRNKKGLTRKTDLPQVMRGSDFFLEGTVPITVGDLKSSIDYSRSFRFAKILWGKKGGPSQ